MRVAGLDISKVATGAAVLDGTKVLHAEVRKCPGDDPGAVFSGFKGWLRPFLLAHGVEHVAIEQPLRTPMLNSRTGELEPKSSMDTYLWLYGLRAVAHAVCGDLNIPAMDVNQSTWRKSFTGNGHAKKEQSLLVARQLYPGLKSKDAAEAIGIAWHLNGELNHRASDMFAKAS
jgi:hypothetical protein